MAGRYEFSLAGESDDAALRELLAATPMDGLISLSFRREPSFFGAARVEGSFYQCIMARERATGRAVACGSRSVRMRYVNGKPVAVGYLSGLRIAPGHRHGSVLADGFAHLRQLHADGRAQMYLTTIAHGNRLATRALTSGRAGLPKYLDAGMYHTAAIPIASRRISSPATCRLRSASADDRAMIIRYLNEVGRTRQFFPVYDEGDLFTPGGSLCGLKHDDLLLAFEGERQIGMLGTWDQRGFRQDVVEGYRWPLSLLRPIHNVFRSIRGWPALPRRGQVLGCVMAALPVITNSDAHVFCALLEQQLARLRGRADYLLVGMHNSDPLLPALRRFRATWYATRLYLVRWDDQPLTLEHDAPGDVPDMRNGSLVSERSLSLPAPSRRSRPWIRIHGRAAQRLLPPHVSCIPLTLEQSRPIYLELGSL